MGEEKEQSHIFTVTEFDQFKKMKLWRAQSISDQNFQKRQTPMSLRVDECLHFGAAIPSPPRPRETKEPITQSGGGGFFFQAQPNKVGTEIVETSTVGTKQKWPLGLFLAHLKRQCL